MSSRSGSFLIICLTMMILLVVIALAALHEIRMQVQISTGNERYLLAEAAARSGLDHALEQIMADYSQPNETVRSAAYPAGFAAPPMTFLDGQFRAPFTAIWSPNSQGVNYLPQYVNDDCRPEDYVPNPLAWWWFEAGSWWSTSMYDGKGRYYEPNYYNATIQPAGSSAPVAATPFSNLSDAAPERTQAVFYDDQFCRIPSSGNVVQDRANARYRLRYTVGVEDLSGHILIDPIPDMQMTAIDAKGNPLTVDYRTPEVRYPWMTAATNAASVIFSQSNSEELGEQLENVFKGRGFLTNVDFDHGQSGLSGFPKTFPLMYRNHSTPDGNGGPGNWASWIDSAETAGVTTSNLYWSNAGSPLGLMGGGEIIPNNSWGDGTNFWPYNSCVLSHCLMGPQLSFDNATYAIAGERAYLAGQIGGLASGWTKFATTPFGRCLTTTGYNPAGPNKWYQGRVDTPFYVNLMTAPPAIVSAMLMSYLPPRERNFVYNTAAFYRCIGPVNGQMQYRQVFPLSQWSSNGPFTNTPIPPQTTAYYGRDLLVDTTAPPSFSPWPAQDRGDSLNPPGAVGKGQYIKPDYYAPDLRSPLKVYPGPFMNGSSAISGQAQDDLGLNYNLGNYWTNSGPWGGAGYGADLHDRQCFVPVNPSQQSKTLGSWNESDDNNSTPPVTGLQKDYNDMANWLGLTSGIPEEFGSPNLWSGPPYNTPPGGANPDPYVLNDYAIMEPDPTHSFNSYFYTMLYAMADAISVYRAEYVQYNNTYTQPSNLFQGGQSPEKYQTLRDLDRIFLADLGESLDAPGTGTVTTLSKAGLINGLVPQYLGNNPQFPAYTSPTNIQTQVQADQLKNQDNSVTSIQRGHIMELLLNDFRMSFMGSSPAYSDNPQDPTKEFRPLDFDGDGQAYCSCYSSVDADGLPCAPAGTKPPNYFTITGNFFIGKSHFYRVFSRGEIWDNLLNMKLNDATLDSALCVDPEGNNPTQTQFLYQRWLYNRYVGSLPRVQR